MPTAIQIKCGNCKHYHESVAAVRACFEAKTLNRHSNDHARVATNLPLASQKQKSFITKLMQERGFDASTIDAALNGLTMGQASDKIKTLLATPKASVTIAAPALTAPKVPAGRYAIEVDGVVKFFKVDCPTDGPWAGRTFVKIQASDELHRVNGETAKAVLVLIAKDPEAASKLYGRELGHCGVCGRTLTDETSRANGIGPICAEKANW